MEDIAPIFVIGHHERHRALPVTSATLSLAQQANYDTLTSPITTPHFHSRVLSQLSSPLSNATDDSHYDITKVRNASPVIIDSLSPADTPLVPETSSSQVIAVTSTWIDLTSPDPIVVDVSRQILKLELAYAAFCGISHVLVNGPCLHDRSERATGITQFAHAMLDALSEGPYMHLHVWMPMIEHDEDEPEEIGNLATLARPQFSSEEENDMKQLDLFGTWEVWDKIRSICKYSSRLVVALRMPELLPPVAIQSRWYSEPVRLLTLERNVFSKNVKGYPVLSKAHQAFITRFVQAKTPPWFLLCNVGPIPINHLGVNDLTVDETGKFRNSDFPTISEASDHPRQKDPTPHLSYMRNLQNKQPIPTALERFGAGYQDYLQAPLQPLTVNLESITYEVFEKDPIKYDWYERAIARALHDWIEHAKPTSNPDGRVVVAVVGAGRGPLVTRALKASEDVGVEIDIWAPRKNPNAFVLLQRHNEDIWDHQVKLIKSDMRTWRGPVREANASHTGHIYNKMPEDQPHIANPSSMANFTGSSETDTTYLLATANQEASNYKIDILISELLGSFADNELSPECLDGVQHLLNPVHGLSIPTSYSTHLTPIAAPKLHADISNNMIATNPQAAEIPYVVMLNAIDYLSTEQQESPTSSTQNSKPTDQNISGKSHHSTSTTTGHNSHTIVPPSPNPIISTAWSFQHPNPSLPNLNPTATTSSSSSDPQPPISNNHNVRHASLTFPIPNRGTCHGIAGYFETILYQSPHHQHHSSSNNPQTSNMSSSVELSTNPQTMPFKSPGMISWFPIYFPLKQPLYIPDDSELTVNMWRRTDERKVWYEWIVDVYIFVPPPLDRSDFVGADRMDYIDNSNNKNRRGGKEKARKDKRKRIRVGGSDLHSSIREACLM